MSRHVLFTVNGTGSPGPWDWGFSSDCGRWLANPWYDILPQVWGPHFENRWRWQPVAYPAAVAPMGPSVDIGVSNTLELLDHPENQGTFALSGYSQGALVTDIIWRDHLLSGSHHHRLDDCIAIINYGDPMRAPGICRGNLYAGAPIPKPLDGVTTGGIAGKGNLTPAQTPEFLLSFNNNGDLYGAAPCGDDPWAADFAGAGYDEMMIFNLIQGHAFKSLFALAEEVVKVIDQPMSHVIPLVQSIYNGLKFVGAGAGPHGDYAKWVPAATTYLLERGHAIAPR